MGRRLPSAGELLIIRPAGKKGQPPHRSNRVIPSFPESLPGSPGIPKQDRFAMRSDGMQLLRKLDSRFLKSHFLRFKEPKVMKKILLTVVLGVSVVAVAQSPQPAQTQPATPAPQAAAAPVIKDPAEYNAYVAAIQQKDPTGKISGLEAFLTQYPNSVMKNQALEILMQTYQQSNNVKKAMETATKLVASDQCHVPALTLLTYVNRMMAQSGDANGKQESADAEKYGQQGLDCLPKFNKPEGTSDADFAKMKAQMTGNFEAGIGWGALQEKNNAKAATHLKAATEANPPDSQKDL